MTGVQTCALPICLTGTGNWVCLAEVGAFPLDALSTGCSVSQGIALLMEGTGSPKGKDWGPGLSSWIHPAATGLSPRTPFTRWPCCGPRGVITCSCFAARPAGTGGRLGLGQLRVPPLKRGQLFPSQCVCGRGTATAGCLVQNLPSLPSPAGVLMAVGTAVCIPSSGGRWVSTECAGGYV